MRNRAARRLLVPALLALACMAVLMGFLWWQLRSATARLNATPDDQSSSAQSVQAASEGYVVDDTGDEALFRLRRGDLLATQGDWAAAAEEYNASANEGGGLTALRKLAQAQLQRRDIEGARDTLARLKKAGARDEDVLLLESIILLRTGNATDVGTAAAQLTAAEDSPHKHYGLSLLAIVRADHAAAVTELTATAAGWEPVLRANARVLLDAYAEFDQFPGSPEIHRDTLLARALAQVQECELALPMVTRVTSVQGDYRDAWTVRGYCELTTERAQESLASFERAYAIDPEKPDIQYFLARAYSATGDHGNALTFAQYALANGFTPKTEASRLVAREALASGNTVLALEQYDALTREPDATIDAFAESVSVAIATQKTEEAYLKAQEAVNRWPDDAHSHDLLGWAAMESGREDVAIASLDRALQIDPDLTSAKERRRSL